MATNFQYQVLADVPDYKIPEFDSIYDDIIEREQEPVYDEFEFIHYDEVTATMPDFFEVFHDDVIEMVKSWEIDEHHNENPELYTNLPIQSEQYSPISFNFGKPIYPGKAAIAGQFYFNGLGSTGSFTLVADRIYYVPIYVPYPMHIVELGCWIKTRDDAGLAWLGLYNTQRGIIKELIYKNKMSLNTTGYKPIPADVWVTEGYYYIALLSNSSSCIIRQSVRLDEILAVNHADHLISNAYWIESGSYNDGLPDEAGVLTIVGDLNGTAPRLFAKIG